MSFFGVGNPFSTVVGQKIEQATDGALPSENWALNMEICDLINTSADGPKDAIKAIRKRITTSAGKNYTIIMYTLTVLETCVKNCGKPFHVLACSKEFIGELVKLIGPKNDPPTVVQEKVLSLIQSWADAFSTQPELQGVGQVYNELKTKGVEFPMTDLDAMAPIFTPQRSVPDGGEPGPTVAGSPQRAAHSPARRASEEPIPTGTVALSPSQSSKLRADLAVVESNMVVMNDMLTELTTQPPAQHHQSDIDLLNELADTLKVMQTRVAELVGRLSGSAPLTGELLHANDQLNNLLLRHSRFTSNRSAVTGGGLPPSAVLGAAMGIPPAARGDDALIDLSDDAPDIAKLTVKDPKSEKSPGGGVGGGGSKDEFDMFAQSRNLTYESSKTGGSSYADNLEEQPSASLASAASQRPTSGQPLPTGMDQREMDEISAWLAQEKAASEANGTQESVTSSDFDRFLAERAAAADSLPAAPAGSLPAAPGAGDRAQGTPHHTPRRQINKDEQDSMFAL